MIRSRVLFKCATAVVRRLLRRLHFVRHLRCTHDTYSQSARTCVVGSKNLRHLASVRLTCMVWAVRFSKFYEHRNTGWARIRHKCHIICITECYRRNVIMEMFSRCSRKVSFLCCLFYMNPGLNNYFITVTRL